MARSRPAAEPLLMFCTMLRELRTTAGNPTLQTLRAAMPRHPGISTLSDVLNARITTAPDWDLVAEFVAACSTLARNSSPARALPTPSADLRTWQVRHADLERQLELLARRPPVASAALTSFAVHRTVPHDVPEFTGRQLEVDRLMATARAAGAGGVVRICVVDGMAGVGKTALVVHVAHRLADDFPDGQLFLELRAHTAGPSPVSPAEALDVLLRMIGVDPRTVPDSIEERAALWRDRLAGRRVLLVLDDAVGHDQVRPLLPGASGCCVMITSRRRVGALAGATATPLDTLPPQDAAELFIRLAPAAADQPEAVAELTRLAGYLPLAIRLLAGKLRNRPVWTVTDLVHELTATLDRSAAIRAEDVVIGAAFDLSYRALPEDVQRLFSQLGMHPGVDFDADSAAALCDREPGDVDRGLDLLYENHLVEEPTRGRYQFHDLIRDFARRLASAKPLDAAEAARNRLLDYYLASATTADNLVRGRTPDGRVPGMITDEQALAWLNTELPNLCACVESATARQSTRVLPLSHALSTCLRRQGHWAQARAVHLGARAVAHEAGDPEGEASALHDLGILQRVSGNLVGARTSQLETLELREDLGDPSAIAKALLELGIIHRVIGDYAVAEAYLSRARSMYGEHHDTDEAAITLHELGIVRCLVGDYSSALEYNTQALAALRQRFDDQVREAGVWLALGVAHREMGDRDAAEFEIGVALDAYRKAKVQNSEAEVLNHLGRLRRLNGDLGDARQHHDSALAIYREVGNQRGQAESLNALGALTRTDDPELAMRYHQEALRLARVVSSQPEEAHACEGLGHCLIDTDEIAGMVYIRRALAIYQRMGVPDVARVMSWLDGRVASPASNE